MPERSSQAEIDQALPGRHGARSGSTGLIGPA
jgi:hypothetical protein